MAKRGLYSNIADKKARIKAGSGEKMRKKGAKVRLLIKLLNRLKRQQRNQKRKREKGEKIMPGYGHKGGMKKGGKKKRR